MPPPPPRPRARDLGLTFGRLPTGSHNAITDVPGVRVGHVTHWTDEPPIARTGVTVIVPDAIETMFARPMTAGTAVLNGAGELTGSVTMAEWGTIETPIALTSTHAVGRVYDGMVDAVLAAGIREVVIPVVGECDDSGLDDITARPVTAADVATALSLAADGPVGEGVVGAGTGMVTMGFKAGIGTASRVVGDLGTVGVLLLCNFGDTALLRIGGAVVGPDLLGRPQPQPHDAGSCLGVVLTDLPLDAHQLGRVARRVGLGLARVGSIAHHGSGEIFCAVSTATRRARAATGVATQDRLADGSLNSVFEAVVDASEEAVVNALFVADTVTGVGGHTVRGLPVERVLTPLERR